MKRESARLLKTFMLKLESQGNPCCLSKHGRCSCHISNPLLYIFMIITFIFNTLNIIVSCILPNISWLVYDHISSKLHTSLKVDKSKLRCEN